jgi:hypothetical protein
MFEAKLLLSKGSHSPRDQEIDVTLAKFTVQRVYIRKEMKHDSGITPVEPFDDGRNDRTCEKVGGSDPQFSG